MANQSYAGDGAGNVAGHLNGLSARFLSVNQKAVYVQCHSHRLNLWVGKSCSITMVRNAMNKIKEISHLFKLQRLEE